MVVNGFVPTHGLVYLSSGKHETSKTQGTDLYGINLGYPNWYLGILKDDRFSPGDKISNNFKH